METLEQKLMAYGKSDAYPFHMPGHKRKCLENINPYAIDITEIDGFDNMNDPKGILLNLMQRLGHLYGREEAYLLVNGSTAGNLSAVFATTKPGDHVVIARNSHKSIGNAAFLRQLKVEYLYPEVGERPYCGAVKAADVEEMLQQYPDIKAVIITSPSYEGIVSPVDEIGRICHEKNVALIVDAAHGAHFGMDAAFPALPTEPDIMVMSLHKTLPSFTSTATVLRKEDGLVDRETLELYLHMFQTSSPSYILMAGISSMVGFLEAKGAEAFPKYVEGMKNFYERGKSLRHLQILREAGQDITKIVIYAPVGCRYQGMELHGEALMEILRRRYGLEMEMAQFQYVLAMTSVMDTEADLQRLWEALKEIDDTIVYEEEMETSENQIERARCQELIRQMMEPKEKVLEVYEAKEQEMHTVPLVEAAGCISAETISLYPPGIPILVPGERIDASAVAYIQEALRLGLTVSGLTGDLKNLKVC